MMRGVSWLDVSIDHVLRSSAVMQYLNLVRGKEVA